MKKLSYLLVCVFALSILSSCTKQDLKDDGALVDKTEVERPGDQ